VRPAKEAPMSAHALAHHADPAGGSFVIRVAVG
jgi:hypothetical protein